MYKITTLIIALLYLHAGCTAQNKTTTAADTGIFNFWLGNWNATWDEQGVTCHGTNNISRMMNDKCIHESFNILDGSSKNFHGESFSVIDKTDGQWKQTWIDSDGNYLTFTGGVDGSTRIFKRSFAGQNGKTIHQRMRFYDIKPNSFSWDWENSEDETNWKLVWRINYSRI